MGKKVRFICSVVGLVGCLLMIVVSIMNIAEVEVPKPLGFVAAILMVMQCTVSLVLRVKETL